LTPKGATKNFSVLKPIAEQPDENELLLGAAHLKTNIGEGAVICLASDVIPVDASSWYVPAWVI